jgi:hypothetical protein
VKIRRIFIDNDNNVVILLSKKDIDSLLSTMYKYKAIHNPIPGVPRWWINGSDYFLISNID